MRFLPDPEIFGEQARLKPAVIYKLARSKAYLFAGVEIRWSCAPSLTANQPDIPVEATLAYPDGLKDFLVDSTSDHDVLISQPFLIMSRSMVKK